MDRPDIPAEFQAFEDRLDQLLAQLRQLREQNRLLREQHEQAAGERTRLLARNDLARSRVEAMIARLKALEQPQ